MSFCFRNAHHLDVIKFNLIDIYQIVLKMHLSYEKWTKLAMFRFKCKSSHSFMCGKLLAVINFNLCIIDLLTFTECPLLR